MRATTRRFDVWSHLSLLGLVSLGSLATTNADAGTVVQCAGAATCFADFSVLVSNEDGSMMSQGGGRLMYDSKSGEIGLDLTTISGDGGMIVGNQLVWMMADGSSIGVTGLSGNADPSLHFGVSANSGAVGLTAAFAFNLPIALSGSIYAESAVSYSMTGSSPIGVSVAPTFGHTNVVTAYEVDTDPLPNKAPDLWKGVDVGDAAGVAGRPVGSVNGVASYSATNFFTGDIDYELMSVLVAFSLTANSSVGISGFVDQIMVPLPAALPLLLSSLAGFGAIGGWRRRAAA